MWSATPSLVARFLLGVALTDDPRRAYEVVLTFSYFTNKGNGAGLHDGHLYSPKTLEDVMADGLKCGWPGYKGDPEEAPQSGLAEIRLEPDEGPPGALVSTWDASVPLHSRFIDGPRDWLPEAYKLTSEVHQEKLLRRSIVLSGLIFHMASKTIAWGRSPIEVNDDLRD